MNYLKDWITPLVKQALYQALELPDSSPNHQELGDSLDDDGSNFRVRSLCSKYVQLINWTGNQTPLEGIFSDSHSLIRGIVSNDARLAYEKKHRGDITKNTMGGVVLIKEFEIVIGQVPTRHPEITLFIQKIILLGCEGSGIFGHPKDVVEDRTICELARQCWGNNRQYEPDLSDNEESLGSSSQPSQIQLSRNITINNDGTLPTQLGLSSQAPPPNNAAGKTRGDGEPIKTSRSGLNSNQLLDALKPKSAGRVISQPRHPGCGRPPVTEEKATSTPRVGAGIPNGHNRMNYEHPKRAKTPPKVSQLTTIALSRHHEKISRPKPNETDSIRNSSSPPIRKPPSTKPKASPVSNNRTSPEKPKVPVRNMPELRMRDKSSFNNWDRIRRYDVLIPKDQQELLDAPDSWVPPDTGQCLPRGRVPLNLLEQWDSLSCRSNVEDSLPVVDAQASSCGSEHGGQRTPTMSLLPESGLPSSEWSLSPDRTANNAVPLDSSPPRSVHRTPQRTAKNLEPNKSPLTTPLLGSTAAGGMLADSAEEFNIESSAFKGLDTSTQEQQIEAHAEQQTIQQTQPSNNVPDFDVPLDSQDSQPVGKSTASKNHDGVVRTPMKSITTPSDILVPATHATSHSKGAAKFTVPYEREPTSPVSPLKATATPLIARKRKAGQVESGYIRPSKLQKSIILKSPGTSNAVTGHRQKFFDGLSDFSRKQEIFNKFKQAYPSYEGDMWIFSYSCNNLQSFRDQGLMQQSFLWDDFVAREVSEYREYAMACNAEGVTPDRYDHYFGKNVTSSRFKKRNLTDKNIKFIAAEFLKSIQSQGSRTLGVEKQPPTPDDDQSEHEFYDAHETASEILGNEPRGMAERRRVNSGEPTAELQTHSQSGIRSQDTSDLVTENKNEKINHPIKRIRRKSHQKQRLPIYPPSKDLNERTQSSSPEISQSNPSPWWKHPATSFKSFAKDYANLLSELGRGRQTRVHDTVVPVDNDGVIEVEPQSAEQGGKMDSMGFEYPWT